MKRTIATLACCLAAFGSGAAAAGTQSIVVNPGESVAIDVTLQDGAGKLLKRIHLVGFENGPKMTFSSVDSAEYIKQYTSYSGGTGLKKHEQPLETYVFDTYETSIKLIASANDRNQVEFSLRACGLVELRTIKGDKGAITAPEIACRIAKGTASIGERHETSLGVVMFTRRDS